jgi:signal transduction histidine kinase
MARLPEITDAGREVDLQELRGPLDSMLAYLDLVLAEDMSEQERRRFLEVVRSSAVRLRNLVDERRG